MVESDSSGPHDGSSPKKVQDGVLSLANMVLSSWGPTLRVALLLGIVIAGVVALAAASPLASIPALGAAGWLVAAARRARRR